jgi:hypothetical protein
VVSTEVNAEKTKYLFVSCEQNEGQHHNINIGTFESVTEFQMFGNSSHLFIYLCTHSFFSLSYDGFIASNSNELKLLS